MPARRSGIRGAAGPLARGHGSNFADLLQAMGASESGAETLREIDPERIDPSPFQPRVTFRAGELEELAASIRTHGLQQPVLVRPRPGGRYELLAGERRWRAVRHLGAPTILARVRDVDDTTAAAIGAAENLHRTDLSAWEEARAVQLLRDARARTGLPLAQEQLAEAVGKSAAWVNQRLRIADAFAEAVKSAAERQNLDVYAVNRALSGVPKARLLAAAQAGRKAVDALLRELLGDGGRDRARAPGYRWDETRRGTLTLRLTRRVEELRPAEARELAERLRSLLEALERRGRG
ncbi:MAG: ParB/RepB/Spo0J family partition protein [Gemmatimonadetes bacterium]|nr:ParB/RepB/Spo0J family partition protein [Gemmatimonadota bacterium]